MPACKHGCSQKFMLVGRCTKSTNFSNTHQRCICCTVSCQKCYSKMCMRCALKCEKCDELFCAECRSKCGYINKKSCYECSFNHVQHVVRRCVMTAVLFATNAMRVFATLVKPIAMAFVKPHFAKVPHGLVLCAGTGFVKHARVFPPKKRKC